MKRQFIFLIILAFTYGQNSVKLPDYLHPESIKKHNAAISIMVTTTGFSFPYPNLPFIIIPGLKQINYTRTFYVQKFDQYIVERTLRDTAIYDPSTGFILSSSWGGRNFYYLFEYDDLNNYIITKQYNWQNKLKYKAITSFEKDGITVRSYYEKRSGLIMRYIFDKKGVFIKRLSFSNEQDKEPSQYFPQYDDLYRVVKVTKTLNSFNIDNSIDVSNNRHIMTFQELEPSPWIGTSIEEIIYNNNFIIGLTNKTKKPVSDSSIGMIYSYFEDKYEYIFIDK